MNLNKINVFIKRCDKYCTSYYITYKGINEKSVKIKNNLYIL